jgi:voltage-gated potassium channel
MNKTAARTTGSQVARDVAISLLALVSVSIGIYQLSAESESFSWLDALDLAIVIVFWVDLVAEVRRSESFARYVRSHWWELPSLIPALPVIVSTVPAVAVARGLRLLRLFRVVGLLMRFRPAGTYVFRLARRAQIDAILGVGAGVVVVGMLVAFAVEGRVNEAMSTMGQAAWFSFNMFTNVAYLDFQPVTLGGRILAGILQLCGIAFIGVFTASLAGAIVREPGPGEESQNGP